ncbi:MULTISPECIES: bifunctional metallophosphatase/5'-nucleotidase [unclassified Enterococcus]|uniref:bifunctional metallophosphatase/5'-nucleotidase n=1 Tax=unclassified Enterococcus TaxID=2608891 RepID=UPI001CE126CB|nr:MULTISPECIES: 5'-nucleotidase C-terminal domain-containing protein [unclassified Enterococcus]MCA5012099.1 5'-nucleotidase C-terminal domain-containing protein [Enterococcus sp. S23]MCA5015350.1 5'-nucleotidase C-terminal domain-containing protein [Enterococcus sp. S22(2020)]
MKKYLSMGITVLLGMGFLAGCSSENKDTASSGEKQETNEKTVTILGTSDIHGRYMAWDYATDVENKIGSFAQIGTIVKEIRAKNDNVLLVDAGDLIQDNSAELYKDDEPHPATEVLKALDYDVWTMGNHEFDYGFGVLDKITDQFEGGVLAGNVALEDGTPYYDAYKIVEQDGVKIGFIGMTTPMVAEFKKDTDIFDGKKLTDPVEETKKAVKDLKKKVDVLVGVVHMGIDNENDVHNTGVADMAEAVPELDVVFAGHMHTLVEEEFINDVLIVEPDKYGRYVSRVDIDLVKKGDSYEVKKKAGSAIEVASYEEDQEINDLLQASHEKARKDANTVLGELTGMDLVPKDEIKGISSAQIQETPLVNFFGEVMLHYSQNADVVAFQIDTDTPSLDMGEIKKKDIARNYQFTDGEVTVYDITGKDLKDYMEWGADYYNQTKPGDVTVSYNIERRSSKYNTNDRFYNVKYDIDLSKKAGERITNLRRLDETPITDGENLKIGMNQYRMNFLVSEDGPLAGRKFKEGYSTFSQEAFGEKEGRIRELAARYIKEEKNGVYEGKLLNNWRIVGVDTEAPERKAVVELINAEIVELPSEEGVTNIASINISEPVTDKEIQELTKKTGLDTKDTEGIKTTGELYQKINELRKK